MNRRHCAAVVVAALAACESPVAVDPAAPGVPIAPDDARVQALVEGMQGEREARMAMRASAHLSIDAPGLTLSRPQRIVVQRPARLRIEVLALFDQVAGVVATDGVDYGFIDLTSGARDTGPVDDGLLWRTARIDLSPADAVALLLGTPRIDPAARVVAARIRQDGTIGVETRGEPAGPVRWFEFDAAGRVARAGLRAADGRAVWTVRFGDWRDVSGRPFAHRADLVFPRVEAEVSVVFHSVEFDPPLAPGLFVLHVAPGG